jgi:hypothetical protein
MHLTVSEQKLLLEMLQKGSITKESQKIFESNKFYNAISILIKNNLIVSIQDGNFAKYELSLAGEIFCVMLKNIKR